MEDKWPHQLTVVDVPTIKPAYRRSTNSSNLLELVDAEINSSCDPRLSPTLSPASVYARMEAGRGDASQRHGDKGARGVADDDWLIGNIADEYKEVAKNLKVRVHINPKFLPILADRAAVAERDSAVTTQRSDILSKSRNILARICEQGKEASSKNKIHIGKDILQHSTRDEVDAQRSASKTANDQQIKVRSSMKVSDAGEQNRNQSTQLAAKVQKEGVKQMQVGGHDRINLIQNEPMAKSCTEISAEDFAIGCIPEGFQRVQSRIAEDGSRREAISPDSLAAVKLEKGSSQNELFPCFASEEIKSSASDSMDLGSVTLEEKEQELKGIGKRVIQAEKCAKNEMMLDASVFVEKPDKEKLKEEVLLLEKMVAEKKALQEERENRGKTGITVTNRDKSLKKIFPNEDNEVGKPLQKSTFAEREYYKHAVVEKCESSDRTINRKHCFPSGERRKVGRTVAHDENKEKIKEKTDDKYNLPVVEYRLSSYKNEISHIKKADPVSLSNSVEPSKQLSKPETFNQSSNSDSKVSHQLDGKQYVYKEPQSRQSVAGRPIASFELNENSVVDKAAVANSLAALGGLRVCTCEKFKDDKLCDFCMEILSSASDEMLDRPLSMLSSRSINICSSGPSFQSVGQKFERIADVALADFEGLFKDVFSIDELESPASEKDEHLQVRLSCLSPDTQFESQFYDCISVRSIQLEVVREWMKQKPLELLIRGRLRASVQRIAGLPGNIASDPLVEIYLEKFSQSADAIMEEYSTSDDTTFDVKELTSDSTEALAKSLFEEIKRHLEVLSVNTVLSTTELSRQSDISNVETHFDSKIPSLNGSKGSGIHHLPGISKHPTVNLEAGSFDLVDDHSSADRTHISRRQKGDLNRSHNVKSLNMEISDIDDMHLPRKRRALSSHVQKQTLPLSEETRLKPSQQKAMEEESNAVLQIPKLTGSTKQTEGTHSKTLDISKASLLDTLPGRKSLLQNTESKEEVAYPKRETVREVQLQTVVPKRRYYSPSYGMKNNTPERYAPEQDIEPKPKHLRNTAKDIWPGHYLGSEDGLSKNTLEKKNVASNAGSVVNENAGTVEKIAKLKEAESERVRNKKKQKKEKKKSSKKRVESEELKSELSLAKPADSKVVLSHLLSEESAIVIGANTDSNSSHQNSAVGDGKQVSMGLKDAKQIVVDVHDLLKLPSGNLPNQSDLLSFSPKAASVGSEQGVNCAEVVQKQSSSLPVGSNFEVKGLIPEKSFKLAMALAMFESEISEFKTDVNNSSSQSTVVPAIPEDVAAELKPEPTTVMTSKRAALKSGQSLLKPSVSLKPGLLTDGSPGPLAGVEDLARDIFVSIHSRLDLVLVKEGSCPRVNAAEETMLLPLEFENKSVHYSLLSPAVMELYQRQVQGVDGNRTSQARAFVRRELTEKSSKSSTKRKLSDSRQESGDWFKKIREFEREKDDKSHTTDDNMDDCLGNMPIAGTRVTGLSIDGCADEDFNLYTFGSDKRALLRPSNAHSIQEQFLNAKGPRFMQTFRQNQIAKRKSLKENPQAVPSGRILQSKQPLLQSKQPLATKGVGKPKPSGVPPVETPPVLSADQARPKAGTCLNSSGAVNISSFSSDDAATSQPLPKGSLKMTSCGEASKMSNSPLACDFTEDLNAIPLPTSVRSEEPVGCAQKSSKAAVALVEHVPSDPSDPAPCGVLPAETCIAASSSEDMFSSPVILSDKMVKADSSTTATTSGNVASSFFVPPLPLNAGPVNPEWKRFPPVEAPTPYKEQLIPPPPTVPRLSSPRPHLVENTALMTSRPYMSREMPVRGIRPCSDLRPLGNIAPVQPPFPYPWPPKNMMMSPEITRSQFSVPPPGMNPSVLIPRQPVLLQPSGSQPGLMPHPGTLRPPPPFAPSCIAQAPVVTLTEGTTSLTGDKEKHQVKSATNTRMYVFNKDKPICKSVEQFLKFQRARSFDPYNVGLLQHLPESTCKVFVHETDLKHLHDLPCLLHLKRDLRVTFACYKDVTGVKFRNYVPLFPNAGLVVIDDAALLACKSESLQMLCDFMQRETKEKNAWNLFISPRIMAIMEKVRLENSEDSDDRVRLTENKRLLDVFKSNGVVQEMENCLQPFTSLDYCSACKSLQTKHCKKFRHFIFITDFHRSLPDSQSFLDSGIDIMNLPEFLKAFVGKSVEHSALVTSAYQTRLTGDAFLDSSLSTAVDRVAFTF